MSTIQHDYSIEELRKEVARMLDRLDPHEPIAAAVVFQVDRAKEHHFVHNAQELARATLKMPGVRKFVYHKQRRYQPDGSHGNALQYLIYEEWETTRYFRAQWDSRHLIHFQYTVGDLVVAPPDLNFYKATAGGGGGGGTNARAIVLKTGAKRCWDARGHEIDCAATGQDGAIQAGEKSPHPRFAEEGRGAIRDRLTNLAWMKDADRFGEVTWEEALATARTLASGVEGLEDGSREGDWRLPNIRELRSLIDYNEADPILPADHPFENVKSAIYWASTTLAAAPLLAWMTTFGIGPSVFVIKSSRCRMWPVRGKHSRLARTGQTKCWDSMGQEIPGAGTGQDGDIQAGVASPSPRFVDDGDGTVKDRFTGLVWTKNAAPFGILPWADAVDACKNLADGRYGLRDGSDRGDWRLPNICEIESLVDYGAFPPPSLPQEATQVFSNIRPTSYWTSTTVASAPNQAMFIILGVGPSIFENKEVPLLAWAVRDARAGR